MNHIFQSIYINPKSKRNDRIAVIEPSFEDPSAALNIFKTVKYSVFFGLVIGGEKLNVNDFVNQLKMLDMQLVQHDDEKLLNKIVELGKSKGLRIEYIHKPSTISLDKPLVQNSEYPEHISSTETMLQWTNDARAQKQEPLLSLNDLLKQISSSLIERDNIDLAYDVIQALTSLEDVQRGTYIAHVKKYEANFLPWFKSRKNAPYIIKGPPDTNNISEFVPENKIQVWKNILKDTKNRSLIFKDGSKSAKFKGPNPLWKAIENILNKFDSKVTKKQIALYYSWIVAEKIFFNVQNLAEVKKESAPIYEMPENEGKKTALRLDNVWYHLIDSKDATYGHGVESLTNIMFHKGLIKRASDWKFGYVNFKESKFECACFKTFSLAQGKKLSDISSYLKTDEKFTDGKSGAWLNKNFDSVGSLEVHDSGLQFSIYLIIKLPVDKAAALVKVPNSKAREKKRSIKIELTKLMKPFFEGETMASLFYKYRPPEFLVRAA